MGWEKISNDISSFHGCERARVCALQNIQKRHVEARTTLLGCVIESNNKVTVL